MKALICEFIGTFALIFVGVGAIAADAGLVGIALAHGLVIAVMASATGAISGGHLNPAVTIAMLATGRIKLGKAAGYIVAQCLGAAKAAWLLTLLIPVDTLVAVNLGTTAPGTGVTPMMAFGIEAILTFFLVFVIFGTAVDPRAPKMGALFIGLTIVLDILIGGPFTGGAMNPARHLGPALLSGGLGNSWIYWLGPILGGTVAGILYDRVLLDR